MEFSRQPCLPGECGLTEMYLPSVPLQGPHITTANYGTDSVADADTEEGHVRRLACHKPIAAGTVTLLHSKDSICHEILSDSY